MDISLHVHASVLDYLTTCIMIVVFLWVVSICRISRQKLTQTRQHTSRWTVVGRGWPEPWGWATRRLYTGGSRRWTSAGSVWWPSPWRSGIDCLLWGYQWYRLYCMWVVKSKENTSIFVCINFHRLNKILVTVSRICKSVSNDALNTIYVFENWNSMNIWFCWS